MDQDLQDLIISLKKQNANSVYELLKAQRQMSELEKKVTSLEQVVSALLTDKENQIDKEGRLTVEKLHELKRFLE